MAEVQGLGKALEALKTAFMDLTELEVVTYTGSVETAVANGKINWAGIMSEGGKTDGKVKLVAASLIKFDGDSYVFRTSDDFTGREDLLKAHAEAVASSVASRQAVISFFGDALKKAVGG